MVNISELKQDFKSHMTVEEVLVKHNVSFGEAVKLCSKGQSRKAKTKRRYEPTGEEYIRKYGKKYIIRRNINGKQKWFGTYDTLEDAIKVRDYLNENGWYSNRVKKIREQLGV